MGASPFPGLILAAAVLAASGSPARAAGPAPDAAAAVLDEINFARAHPADYARRLMLQPVSDWEAGLSPRARAADPGAFAQAVDVLLRQPPLPPLEHSPALEGSAREQVAAQGPAGLTGHDGPGGERFDARLRRHGAPAARLAENIAYGPPRAADVVRELIVDRGVADRGHRRNIFDPALGAAGVACGPHAALGAMCVIDFAAAP